MCAMTSVGFWTCSMTLAIVNVLPDPGDAEQGLVAVAGQDALGELVDGLRLVAGRPVSRRHVEVGHDPT